MTSSMHNFYIEERYKNCLIFSKHEYLNVKILAMKVFCVLAALAFSVTAVPIPEEERVSGVNGWYVPQIDGSYNWVTIAEGEQILEDLKEKDLKNENQAISGRLSTVPVHFYLYTNKNPTKAQKISVDKKSIEKSDFDASNPTKFVVHGWIQGHSASMNEDIRAAWLSRGKFNVIIVAWDRARSIDYASSVLAVPAVGRKIANLIDYLVECHNMILDETEIIGHSLGAHVAGFAGKNIKTGKLRAIIALDAALPLFSYNKPDKRLNINDAQYVEAIHTNGGALGFLQPLGIADFYPNGGKSQPGCGWDLTGSCDHTRSYAYYAEAVARESFPSIACGGYVEAVKNKCSASYSNVKMAAPTNAFAVKGEFYVPVYGSSPFGYGFQK